MGKKAGAAGTGGSGYTGTKSVYVTGVYAAVPIILEVKCEVVKVSGVDEAANLCNVDETVVYSKSPDPTPNIAVVLYNSDDPIIPSKCDGITMSAGVFVILYKLLEAPNSTTKCCVTVGLTTGGTLEI